MAKVGGKNIVDVIPTFSLHIFWFLHCPLKGSHLKTYLGYPIKLAFTHLRRCQLLSFEINNHTMHEWILTTIETFKIC